MDVKYFGRDWSAEALFVFYWSFGISLGMAGHHRGAKKKGNLGGWGNLACLADFWFLETEELSFFFFFDWQIRHSGGQGGNIFFSDSCLSFLFCFLLIMGRGGGALLVCGMMVPIVKACRYQLVGVCFVSCLKKGVVGGRDVVSSSRFFFNKKKFIKQFSKTGSFFFLVFIPNQLLVALKGLERSKWIRWAERALGVRDDKSFAQFTTYLALYP